MTDYLELVLSAAEDEDGGDEGEAMELPGKEFFGRRAGKASYTEETWAAGEEQGQVETLRDYLPDLWRAGDDHGQTPPAAGMDSGFTAVNRHPALTSGFPSANSAADTGAKMTAPLEDAAERTAIAALAAFDILGSGESVSRAFRSAERLERRLSARTLAAENASGGVRIAREDEGAERTADWVEFDRRLERDARRYDGSMGLY